MTFSLLGAGYTIVVSYALGTLVMRPVHKAGELAVRFVVGAACLSWVVFGLCLVHAARWQVFLAVGVVAIALGYKWGRPPGLPSARIWPLLILVPFAVWYFINALAPEVSPDGSGYHLGNVLHDWHAQGFDWQHRNMYSYMPQGMEMLFLFAYSFGGNSAAALVHLAFFTALPLMLANYGAPGLFAAVVVFTSPIAGIAGSSAYNDPALATTVFAVFVLLEVWNEVRDRNLVWLIGLLAGFAYSIKYTGALAVPFALAWLPWRSWWRALAPAGLLAGSWALRNWVWAGNPFAPFFNRWFPNPWFHIGAEQSYLLDQRTYNGIQHAWEIPIQLAFRGGKVPGIIGPVFLLAPVALLALRWRLGRRALVGAAIFALPALANVDSRFLLPSLPFLALAMGMAFANSWGVLPALAVFEALACWPTVLAVYCDDWAWRLREVPLRAALRIEPESAYLTRRVRDYGLKSEIEQAVPKGERIFSFAGRAEAYLDREIVVGYESALGNRVQDDLQAMVGRPPVDRLSFHFAPVRAEGVRVVETADAVAHWTVAEMRVRFGGRELRVEAWPNRWEAGLAFDGNPTTRWSTWEPMRSGARLGVVFPKAETADEVELDCAAEAGARLDVEILGEGSWRKVEAKMGRTPIQPELRRNATLAVRAEGIRFLLVEESDFTARDMKEHSKEWGIETVAESNGTRLYRIN
jgi:hypothetical protein